MQMRLNMVVFSIICLGTRENASGSTYTCESPSDPLFYVLCVSFLVSKHRLGFDDNFECIPPN